MPKRYWRRCEGTGREQAESLPLTWNHKKVEALVAEVLECNAPRAQTAA
jgi:hypothetical protein